MIRNVYCSEGDRFTLVKIATASKEKKKERKKKKKKKKERKKAKQAKKRFHVKIMHSSINDLIIKNTYRDSVARGFSQ